MPRITLREGDFGADVEVMVGSGDLYLPDPAHPGLTMAVPLADVVEMESADDGDAFGVVKDAVVLGAMGLLLGRSGMMADGFSSATRVKETVFNAVLRDGRKFVAVADARTYAELRSAHLEARREARVEAFADDTPDPADEVIAKYLAKAKVEEPAPVAPPAAPPAAAQPAPVSPAVAPAETRPAPAGQPDRPVFGRRGR